MNALIMMLFNLKEETYHPILYFEHPFSGNIENSLYRFRSKGHRTIGFKDRQEALNSIQTELIDRLPNYKIYKDLDCDLPWDGENIPTDNQFRGVNFINAL